MQQVKAFGFFRKKAVSVTTELFCKKPVRKMMEAKKTQAVRAP